MMACLSNQFNMRQRANKKTSRSNFFSLSLRSWTLLRFLFPCSDKKNHEFGNLTIEMHCFASENQIYTGKVIFPWRWVFKVFKRSRKPTAEKFTTENPRGKRLIFVMESIFCRKVGIQSTIEMGFKRTETLWQFSNLMRPHYCRSADAADAPVLSVM